MHFNSSFFRLFCTFCLVFSLSAAAFADTIRLKDGSIIKGKIINYTNGKFTVAVGEGTRQRQMSFSADDIESIQFDSPQVPANTIKVSNQNASSAPIQNNSTTENEINTVRQTDKTVTALPDLPVAEKDIAPEPKPVLNTNQPASTTTVKPKPIALNVKVLADNTSNGWTNSGFVVKKGQKIRIAADGQVSLGSGRFTTPSGIATLPDDGKLMKNVPTGALIVVIGDDNNDFIYVGAEREFVASRDGSLFLGINEGNLNDNSGVYDVKVEIDLN